MRSFLEAVKLMFFFFFSYAARRNSRSVLFWTGSNATDRAAAPVEFRRTPRIPRGLRRRLKIRRFTPASGVPIAKRNRWRSQEENISGGSYWKFSSPIWCNCVFFLLFSYYQNNTVSGNKEDISRGVITPPPPDHHLGYAAEE